MLFQGTVTTTLWDRYTCFHHFIEKQSEAQRGAIAGGPAGEWQGRAFHPSPWELETGIYWDSPLCSPSKHPSSEICMLLFCQRLAPWPGDAKVPCLLLQKKCADKLNTLYLHKAFGLDGELKHNTQNANTEKSAHKRSINSGSLRMANY